MADPIDVTARSVYPSITALRMLEAVARLGTLQRAAEWICVTPSAVSHQLRKLEDSLGVKLINRIGRKVELTSAGNRYVKEIRKALKIVELASLPLGGSEPFGRLRIRSASGLGSFWLAHHIGEFLELYPNIDLELSSQNDYSDLSSDNVDFSIVYGDGAWPGMYVKHLFTPHAFPVCSPSFLDRVGRIPKPEALANFPLLHHCNQGDWVKWLSAATTKSIQLNKGIIFSDITHCLNAAVAGTGIAMGDDVLARDALIEGKLIRLFETQIEGPSAYFIVGPKERVDRRASRLAIDWMSQWFAEFSLGQHIRAE
ncbi:LysR substrate-binding domain-containing protein [Roseovarius sp. ZX-A-9]|uniref:LysR substrate-binding domain-containing protein n=1 Tax=Roseovarius sp. ZX-A-9 TaxID=3014783 RepID=UPI00232DFB7A|nr:LysR substrate-binding domain-containing protein [Roseovarius sp. ZX-A-9]